MRYLLTTLFIILFSACSVKVIQYEQPLISLVDNPTEYGEEDSRVPKNNLLRLNVMAGDTVNSIAYAEPTHWESWVKYTMYYKINYDGKVIKVSPDDFTTAKNYKFATQPTTVRVSVQYDQTVWSRSVHYIQKHSDMKIQLQSDILIETYNPTSLFKIGYSINKVKYSDYYEYTINALKYNSKCAACLEAKKLAYYITDFEMK